jgi:hypothetical protein
LWRFTAVEAATGRCKPPDLLGHAMHVNREADAAIADEGQPQFFFAHSCSVAKHRTIVECGAIVS